MSNNIPYVLTRQEAQEILRVSKGKILKYIKEGKLEASYYGNGYRITSDAIDAFIKNSGPVTNRMSTNPFPA